MILEFCPQIYFSPTESDFIRKQPVARFNVNAIKWWTARQAGMGSHARWHVSALAMVKPWMCGVLWAGWLEIRPTLGEGKFICALCPPFVYHCQGAARDPWCGAGWSISGAEQCPPTVLTEAGHYIRRSRDKKGWADRRRYKICLCLSQFRLL